MKLQVKPVLAMTVSAIVASQGMAGTMSIKVTLPTIEQTGSRPPTRPYVAIWVRRADHQFAGNLAVWYMIEDKPRRRPGGVEGGPPPQARERREREQGGEGRPREDGALPPVRSENTPGGARWMNGVREWWADSGHELKFPVDGLTSASRPAGTHELTFESSDPKLAGLAPGQYLLMIEAAREHGGDETISIPFTWPIKSAQSAAASGKTELGAAELKLAP